MSWVEGVSLQSGFIFVSDSVPGVLIVMFFPDSAYCIITSVMACTFGTCIFPMKKGKIHFLFSMRV